MATPFILHSVLLYPLNEVRSEMRKALIIMALAYYHIKILVYTRDMIMFSTCSSILREHENMCDYVSNFK